MNDPYDIAVLGAGPGGYIAALKAAQRGARVALVEKEHLGGACLNYGCIPSKALLAAAELIHRVGAAADFGVQAGRACVDWPRLQQRKDRILRSLRNGIRSLLTGRQVTTYQGRGVLEGAGRIVVTSAKGETQTVLARRIILAVGSVPARLPGWPSDPAKVCTSDEALHWKDLPRRLLIVGGGVIGCEFACMMREFGVETTLVEMMPELLPGLDTCLGQGIHDILRKRGVACWTATRVEDLKEAGDDLRAVLSNGQTVEVDRVLVAVGRRPNTDGIGLETIGIETQRGFVRANDRMETTAAGIYSIGDVNGRCLLAHAASAHGIVAAENATGLAREFSAPIPYAVYTFPEIAAVGLTQEQARAEGIPVSIGVFPFAHLGKAMTVNATEGCVKVIRNREDGRLLGVHMLGHNVTESIAAATAYLHQKASVREIVESVVAHPTMTEALREASEDALGMALHLPPRKVVRLAV